MLKIAINGFGRIGRNVLRALYESGRNQAIKVIAINEIADPEGIAHLLKYDTAHGRFKHDVRLDTSAQATLYVDNDAILLSQHADIADCPWGELGWILSWSVRVVLARQNWLDSI